MIFHVYHSHNELTCPINDTDLFLSSFGSVVDSLEANNVEVIGAWIDGPGHKSFYIIVLTQQMISTMDFTRSLREALQS